MLLEIVKQYYEAFNRRDINEIISLCADDVINDPNQGIISQIGKENLRKFIETAWAHFDEKVYELDLMSNSNQSNIASEYLVKGTYYKTKDGLFPATNQYYEIICTSVFKLNRENKISRITRYYNSNKWLDMVKPRNEQI